MAKLNSYIADNKNKSTRINGAICEPACLAFLINTDEISITALKGTRAPVTEKHWELLIQDKGSLYYKS